MARNRPVPHIPAQDRAFVKGLLIHEDEALLAFNKPSGLPSQVRGNRARNLDHLLWTFAKSNGKRPRLVHRLDSGTSGLILAARTQPDTVTLSAQFEARSVEKTYLALVTGGPNDEEGTINATIARIEKAGRSRIICGHPDGKPAMTKWRVLARGDEASLIEARPKTGRIHQIRVHLAHLGCPIMGDKLYGSRTTSRMALHAASLSFNHPRSGARTELGADVPEDFMALAETLGFGRAVFEGAGLT